MRYIYSAGLVLLIVLTASAHTVAMASEPAPRRTPPDAVPVDSAETTRLWNMARAYKAQMRLEMARQQYLLALATCRSEETVQRIQRELQIVELQIRSLR